MYQAADGVNYITGTNKKAGVVSGVVNMNDELMPVAYYENLGRDKPRVYRPKSIFKESFLAKKISSDDSDIDPVNVSKVRGEVFAFLDGMRKNNVRNGRKVSKSPTALPNVVNMKGVPPAFVFLQSVHMMKRFGLNGDEIHSQWSSEDEAKWRSLDMKEVPVGKGKALGEVYRQVPQLINACHYTSNEVMIDFRRDLVCLWQLNEQYGQLEPVQLTVVMARANLMSTSIANVGCKHVSDWKFVGVTSQAPAGIEHILENLRAGPNMVKRRKFSNTRDDGDSISEESEPAVCKIGDLNVSLALTVTVRVPNKMKNKLFVDEYFAISCDGKVPAQTAVLYENKKMVCDKDGAWKNVL